MTTDEIKAGLEMDWIVKELMGIRSCSHSKGVVLITSREWDELRGIEHPTCEGDVATVPFQPSTDLNAAFAAAEKIGLFNECILLRRPPQNDWVVWDDRTVGKGPTPALAISEAILELHPTTEVNVR